MGEIEDKVHISPADAEIGAELGKMTHPSIYSYVIKPCEVQNLIFFDNVDIMDLDLDYMNSTWKVILVMVLHASPG